jgi:hypothetical protein
VRGGFEVLHATLLIMGLGIKFHLERPTDSGVITEVSKKNFAFSKLKFVKEIFVCTVHIIMNKSWRGFFYIFIGLFLITY